MGKAERDKGAQYERKAAQCLRENGWPDTRRYLAGDGKQPGDLDAIPATCIDVKARRTLAIPAWLRQVEEEAAGKRLPLLWVWRPGLSDPLDWWAVTTMRYQLPLLGQGT